MSNAKEWYKTSEVAELLEVEQQTIRNWIITGRFDLRVRRLGPRTIQIHRSSLHQFVREELPKPKLEWSH